MAIVRWADEARSNLADILAYIEQDNPTAAINLAEKIIASGSALALFPARNPVRHFGGVRERPVLGSPYILLYRVERDDLVVILAVRHGARENRMP